MADYTPTYAPGADVTYTTNADVTAGQVVAIAATGYIVAPAAAASQTVIGVADHDALSGASLTVSRGGVQRLKASGAITAGNKVKAGAAGTVAAFVFGTDNSSLVLGTAINTAADTALVDVSWGV